MAISTIKRQNASTDISSSLQLVSGCVICTAIKTGRLIEICIRTPAFASAGEQTLGSISSAAHYPGSDVIVSGNLYPATDTDFGYGTISINYLGEIKAYYSKATQYGLYATLIYFSV